MKTLLAIVAVLVVMSLLAWGLGTLLGRAAARARPLDDEQLNEGGWRSW